MERKSTKVNSKVTPLEELQQKFALLMINTEEPFILVGLDLNIITFNDQFQKQYSDYFKIEVVKGVSILNYAQNGTKADLEKLYHEVIEGTVKEKTIRLTLPDNNFRSFLLKYKPAYDEQKNIIAVFVSSTDISEAIKAKEIAEASRSQQALLASIIDSSEDGIISKTLEGVITSWNRGAEKLFGYPAPEAIGKNISIIIPEAFLAEEAFITEKIKAGESLEHYETERKRKDGTIIYVSLTISPVRDSKGVITGMSRIIRDISERKAVDDRVKNNAKRFRSLLQNSIDGLMILSVDGIIQEISPSGKQILGFGPDERLERMPAEFCHPDELNLVTHTFVEVAEHPGNVKNIEFRFLMPGGDYKWIEATFHNQLYEPTVNAIVLNYREINERKNSLERLIRSEERYRSLFNDNPLPVFIFDFLTKEIIEVNDATLSKYGYARNEFIGMSIMQLRPAEDVALLEDILKTEEDYKRVSETTWRHLKKSGELMYMNIAGNLINYNGRRCVVTLLQDVTEKIRAEMELRKSHELLQKLTEKLPLAVYQFEMDAAGRMSFPFTNKAIDKLMSVADIDSLKEDASAAFSAVHPEDLDGLFASIVVSRQHLTAWDFEFRTIAPGNGIIWLKGYSQPEEKEDGSVVWYGYLQNITERRLADESIKIANERYENVAKATNETIWDWDIESGDLHWGTGFKDIFGYEVKEGETTVDFWVRHIHPDDKDEVFNSVMLIVNSKTFNQWQYEYRYRKADGSYAEVLDRGFVMRDKSGKSVRMIGAMLDISDRKRANESIRIAKERYDMVAKATNDAIYDWDLVTGEVIRAGEGFKALFGYDPNELHTDAGFWRDNMHPDDMGSAYGILNSYLLDPDRNICAQEYRFKRADGSYGYVFDKGYIIRDRSGKAIRLIGATQDISQRKEAEAQLTALNAVLEKRAEELALSNTELEQFAYVASHDLQEPLRMVTSFLALLEDKYKGQLDDKADQYIFFAKDGAVRMRKIILDLLEYSRVGRQVNNAEVVDIHELLSGVVQLHSILIEEKKALIELKDLPVIRGHKSGLQQLFQNLLGNALKYQRPGEAPRVKISAIETPTHWQFAIADNGIGIDSQFFDKIFVVFQRLHNRAEYSGTGIGLAICKKIVENHQGKIWVESSLRSGSIFNFTIAK